MIRIQKIIKRNKKEISTISDIHIETFKGFFLTFLGKGFLKCMYSSFVDFSGAELIVAYEEDRIVGFLAYSEDLSGLYRFMLRHKFFKFVIYAVGAFFRRPKTFFRLFRALLKPNESKRNEKYIHISSIGVRPNYRGQGIGSMLLKTVIETADFTEYNYISLETDADNNDQTNLFYIKNGFKLEEQYLTHEGRKMNEYRLYK